MSQVKKVAVLVGSLRKESINRKIALALADLAPESIQLEIVDIGDLPLYSEDIDAGNLRQPIRPSVKKSKLLMRYCSLRRSTTARFPPR